MNSSPRIPMDSKLSRRICAPPNGPAIEAASGLSRDALTIRRRGVREVERPPSSATAWASPSTGKGTSQRAAESPTYYYLRGNFRKNPAPASAHCAAIPMCRGTARWGVTEKKPPARPAGRDSNACSAFKPPPGAWPMNAIAAMQAIIDGKIQGTHLSRRQSCRSAAPNPAQLPPGPWGALDLAVHIGTKFESLAFAGR